MREVEAGISFCLSLPLDFPGGTALNQRRHPPVLAPTEDMDGNAGDLLQRPHERDARLRRPQVRRRVGRRRRDPRRCSTRRSGTRSPTSAPSSTPTATASRRPSTTTATAPASTSSGRPTTPRGDGSGHRSFAHHLGLEHMAFHGVQGRGVLVDLAHHLGHDWRGVDRADAAGDHGGRRRRGGARRHAPAPHRLRHQGPRVGPRTRPARDLHDRAPTSTPTTSRCSSGSPTRRSRRWWPTTTRSRGCSARTATRAATRSCRSTTSACSSSASRSASCGTCTSWPTWLREHDRSRFLLTAPPLRLPGIVGSPLTPIATV